MSVTSKQATRVYATRILCVWLPNWPIQRLVVQRPELRRQQVLLFRRDSRRGQLVNAASPLARQAGCCVGMPLSEAKSLLRRSQSQETFLFEHDLKQDLQAIEQLCQSLESFSPTVGLESIEERDFKRGKRPAALLLDVTGLAHLFGDEHHLACRLMKHLESDGYLGRVAIANTVGAAWAAAHFLSSRFFREQQQPLVIAADDSHTLDELPVEALRLDETIIDTLYQLGICRLNQLMKLSRDDLAMRFGNAIHRRIDQLQGAIEEPVVAFQRPAEFNAQQLLEYPTRHRETIEVIIARLVELLCRELRSQQQGALQWRIRLLCTTEPIEFTVSLFQPSTSVEEIMPLVEMQSETIFQAGSNWRARGGQSTKAQPAKKRKRVRFEVNEICVSVASHVLLVQQQRDLFDDKPRLGQQALSHLINRLAGRLGNENVVYPTLQSGAQPEYSYRLKPLVDANRRRRRQTAKSKDSSHRLARPIRLYHRPVMIEVTFPSASSTTQTIPDESLNQSATTSSVRNLHQPPTAIMIEQTVYKVVAAWGPERIETGWWRGPTVCRDYWRIATDRGQHFWVYRDLRRNCWWLHGSF
ncbi:DNA polymerase Y family protein [Mariniblastus sp.]|nr:DNA polymerase Y family protein [Mariniblastus sp.]